MQTVTIKGNEFEHIQDVHRYLSRKLSFPPYYGMNFSALYDALSEICEYTQIIVDLTQMAHSNLLDEFHILIQVMLDAADENHSLEIQLLR